MEFKEPYDNLDMITCRLSSSQPGVYKVHLSIILKKEGLAEKERKFDTAKSGWSFVHIEGSRVIISEKIYFFL